MTLTSDGSPQVLFCDNETNTPSAVRRRRARRYPKDGINDHVVSGRRRSTRPNAGTKAAFWHVLTVAAGADRRGTGAVGSPDRHRRHGADHGLRRTFIAARKAEADAFYATVLSL